MLHIFADALLIATRMDGLSRRSDTRRLPEADLSDRRQEPPSRLLTFMGVRL